MQKRFLDSESKILIAAFLIFLIASLSPLHAEYFSHIQKNAPPPITGMATGGLYDDLSDIFEEILDALSRGDDSLDQALRNFRERFVNDDWEGGKHKCHALYNLIKRKTRELNFFISNPPVNLVEPGSDEYDYVENILQPERIFFQTMIKYFNFILFYLDSLYKEYCDDPNSPKSPYSQLMEQINPTTNTVPLNHRYHRSLNGNPYTINIEPQSHTPPAPFTPIIYDIYEIDSYDYMEEGIIMVFLLVCGIAIGVAVATAATAAVVAEANALGTAAASGKILSLGAAGNYLASKGTMAAAAGFIVLDADTFLEESQKIRNEEVDLTPYHEISERICETFTGGGEVPDPPALPYPGTPQNNPDETKASTTGCAETIKPSISHVGNAYLGGEDDDAIFITPHGAPVGSKTTITQMDGIPTGDFRDYVVTPEGRVTRLGITSQGAQGLIIEGPQPPGQAFALFNADKLCEEALARGEQDVVIQFVVEQYDRRCPPKQFFAVLYCQDDGTYRDYDREVYEEPFTPRTPRSGPGGPGTGGSTQQGCKPEYLTDGNPNTICKDDCGANKVCDTACKCVDLTNYQCKKVYSRGYDVPSGFICDEHTCKDTPYTPLYCDDNDDCKCKKG